MNITKAEYTRKRHNGKQIEVGNPGKSVMSSTHSHCSTADSDSTMLMPGLRKCGEKFIIGESGKTLVHGVNMA